MSLASFSVSSGVPVPEPGAGGSGVTWPMEIQSRLHAASQIGRFAHTMHVHEVDVRVVPEEMVVQRGDIDSVIQQSGHDGVHFFLQEHQVAHHHVQTVATLGERNPAAESKGVGVEKPWMDIFKSLRGMLTLRIPALKSPFRSRNFRTS